MLNDPDQDLVRAAREGDKAAFGKLVGRYYHFVYAVSFGVLRSREEALDVTQEVFLKAFQQLQNFEGQSKFKTWLYRIAVNTAIDTSRRRHPSEPLEEATKTASKSPGPREEAWRKELSQLVKNGLDALDPAHRAILILREFNELSYEEIAQTLGIEMGTVMSRLFYARKKLAEAVGLELEGSE